MFQPKQILKDIYPSQWKDSLNLDKTDIQEFRNITHFKNYVSKLAQITDNMCGISYANAVKELQQNKPQISSKDYQIIKNRVKNNLIKRGLLSEHIYESYKYATEGEIIDVTKVVDRDPECFLTPAVKYKNYFYELYVSISYPHFITNQEVMDNLAKILATVELLEQQHIYTQITLVVHSKNLVPNKSYFGIIPLFSYKDVKSIETMSAILNDRLLRKFFFAIWENAYGSNLHDSYGQATEMPYTIRPMNIDECELASDILNQVITPGDR